MCFSFRFTVMETLQFGPKTTVKNKALKEMSLPTCGGISVLKSQLVWELSVSVEVGGAEVKACNDEFSWHETSPLSWDETGS